MDDIAKTVIFIFFTIGCIFVLFSTINQRDMNLIYRIIFSLLCGIPSVVCLFLSAIGVSGILFERKRRRDFNANVRTLITAAYDGSLPADKDRETIFHIAEQDDVPETPVIIIGRRGEVEATIVTTTGQQKASLLALVDGHSGYFRFYAADGRLWTENVTYRKPWSMTLTKLLANTIYNPYVDCYYTWQFERSYTLHELREMLCLCVDIDNDHLTQRMKPDTLRKRIREANTFDQMIKVLNRTGAIAGRTSKPRKKKRDQ